MRALSQLAVSALSFALWLTYPGEAEAKLPQESPRHGEPYRTGIVVDLSVGMALCQPALNYRSRCGQSSLGRAAPGLALRVGGGWRFSPSWQLSAAWVRQGHRPAGDYSGGNADGGMLAARGILPLPRQSFDTPFELGLELGLGWSRRVLERSGSSPQRQSSTGALVRPALIFDAWVLADFAIGLEVATQLNFHTRYCVDNVCESRPGDWVPVLVERRWVDGLTVGLRFVGSIFPRV